MAVEIERKFLVTGDDWRAHASRREPIRQAYFPGRDGFSIRIRRIGHRAFLTIKSAAAGLKRDEFEYPIPGDDADVLLTQLAPHGLIEKTRHFVEWDGADWVVDEFTGALSGLILAEIELEDENEQVAPPPWAGQEVTDDPAYRNTALAEKVRKA